MGSLLRTYSTAANAARAAGRAASIAGADPMADRMVLSRLQREAAGGFKGQIRFVVIWHAAGPGQGPPAGCIPTSMAAPNTSTVGVSDGGVDAVGACNVYIRPEAPGGAFERVAAAPSGPNPAFGCQGPGDPQAGSKLDCAWPGKNRRAVTSPRSAATPVPTDLIGVHVEFEHRFHTALVSPSRTVRETTINLIEPVGYEFG